MQRTAIVARSKIETIETQLKTTRALLPDNYDADIRTGLVEFKGVVLPVDYVFVYGEDVAGWTMDEYVIPRAASGLIFMKEVT